MLRAIAAAFAALLVLFSTPAVAQMGQQPFIVGGCGVSSVLQYSLYSDGMLVQVGNPNNRGMTARDPTGMMFLMLPSTDPRRGYFIDWQGRMIEIAFGYGWGIVGACQIQLPPPPPPPFFGPPAQDFGVAVPGGLAAVPGTFIDPNNPFAAPMIATEADAQECHSANDDVASVEFQNCLVHKMAGKRERAVYDCARQSEGDGARMATCTVGALGGEKERRIAAQIEQCRQNFGADVQQYPLCFAGQQFDGDTATLIGCIQQQSAMGQVSALATAACYGGAKLNLNPEAQIAVQCAVATDGQPEAFVGCAGGLLTKREMEKCRDHGIGGPDGCFGPNNDIIKHLRGGGLQIAAIYGPANPLVEKWNAAVTKLESGARDEAIQLLKESANTLAAAPGTAARQASDFVSRAMPRITVGKPKLRIGGHRYF